ncbi:hypothetical protein VUJ46_16285 [Chryseobacterium sp. MYb264]|uniref:hypothetical protein n=1 Tax=Chryseobacterium sp. MYb264 TaxID=2745153 RepID=UPI002E124D60|nr:hypothetical protein VUJ46_16285 [Chryseobacterium sp. MYb264]
MLTRILEFIQNLIREFKKGVKNLFSQLEGFIDEIFGFGEKVGDHALTPAQRRVKEKQKLIQDKIEKKNNVERGKQAKQNKRRFESFKEKWEGKSIIELSKTEITNALKGYTEQANKVARLIEEGKMEFRILDDVEFEKILIDSGDTLEEAIGTAAFCIDENTFYRASTSAEKLLSEFVHEGTHALDSLEDFVGDTYQWEKRAFFHERAFQESVGLDKDFDTIREMLDFIYVNY